MGALHGVGVEGGVLNLISSILCWWEIASCCRVLNDGTPQLGVLSPLLWNFIMRQLLQSIDQQPVYTQAYADNIVLLARSCNLGTLHNSITACLAFASQWANAIGLTFNHSKSEAIVFTWRRWILPPLFLSGESLTKSTKVKYLG